MRRNLSAGAVGLLVGLGCSNADHPAIYQRKAATTEPDDAGTMIPVEGYDASVAPPENMTGLCGNQILRPVSVRPNLYLILDRSGSMDWPFEDPTTKKMVEKWRGVRTAIHTVLYALGHRLAYGAAVFPRFGEIDSCAPGAQIDKIADGDSVTYARNGLIGPHLTKLEDLLGRYVPEGATPTSATLNGLLEPLIALGSNTTVILATDGAPNCNENAVCDAAHCIANIEGAGLSDGTPCTGDFNCCDPSIVNGPTSCIDADASVVPIAQLLAHGIRTYVVGLPGSEAYEDVLNRLATAGGTARGMTTTATAVTATSAFGTAGAAGAPSGVVGASVTAAGSSGVGGAASVAAGGTATATGPLYYPATDAEVLTNALRGITASIAISCTIPLDQSPPDWSQVNVYFDNSVIKRNPNDGWKQLDARTIEITGTLCELLRSGDVFQVQIVAGCPTEELI